jgi:UDP-N-acetylmuramoyl-L-alanyl-D-glutamate--2,6-diaminopimelate ligase
MRLSALLTEASLEVREHSGPDPDLVGVCIDSRQCGEGSCFVAMRGAQADGHDYIEDAVSRGVSAVVAQESAGVSGVAQVLVANSRVAAGRLAQAFAGWPGRKLISAGVTGTNGKTTVAHMLRSMLAADARRPGLLGTIGYDTGTRRVSASRTTPDPVGLANLMAEMVEARRTHLVMEVSSHALDQDRTAGLDFAVGIFTNLTGDHMDYHQTMDAYREAKGKLFAQLSPDATAVINADDPAGDWMQRVTAARVVRYSLQGRGDYRGRIRQAAAEGTSFRLEHPGGQLDVEMPLIGRHNVRNALAAAAAAGALGVEMSTVRRVLQEMPFVAGRLQRVGPPGDCNVFVDYAHTDDALRNVLQSLRPLARGRLILVFGCGGQRDQGKRPRMAAVAEEFADSIIVTNDNPRNESPEAILDQILAGFSRRGPERVAVEPDRRKAIRRAIGLARKGDLVLIAGKGHENYQILGDKTIPFDDANEARQAMLGETTSRSPEGGSET